MSHFSKIQTNISSLEVLQKTLGDLGFEYINSTYDLIVFNQKQINRPLFSFSWDGKKYDLIADLNLWSLNISFECFMDKLNQCYAFNVILNESVSSGFNQKEKVLMKDGSLKLIIEKWAY
uniref:Uncharacterized protein ycf35 n=1 Tax=Apoglossum ruscifolium TaxID=167976 RepID=A0A4D6WP43_9FLOR|nr:hypothetical protein [Apoglossum ruscifolium]